MTLLLNKEINILIGHLAKKMGTSKRNVISLALSNIIDEKISSKKIEEIQKSIHGLNHPINITVNTNYKEKLYNLNRHGLSIRKFLGYIVCDYFHTNYKETLEKEFFFSDDELHRTERENIQMTLEKDLKEKIAKYCEDNAISINSLFSHFIINKGVEKQVNNLILDTSPENKQELLNLTFSTSVKSKMRDNANGMNLSYRYYLYLIALQIKKDLRL